MMVTSKISLVQKNNLFLRNMSFLHSSILPQKSIVSYILKDMCQIILGNRQKVLNPLDKCPIEELHTKAWNTMPPYLASSLNIWHK